MKAGAQHEGLSGRCAVTTAALLFSSSPPSAPTTAWGVIKTQEVMFRTTRTRVPVAPFQLLLWLHAMINHDWRYQDKKSGRPVMQPWE